LPNHFNLLGGANAHVEEGRQQSWQVAEDQQEQNVRSVAGSDLAQAKRKTKRK
jgi:hypothetical protein